MKKYAIILILLFFSCKQKNQNLYRDYALKEYFRLIDSLHYYDTIQNDYKFVKAYNQNDSLALSNSLDELKSSEVWEYQEYWCDSFPLKELSNFDAQEAYRYYYSFAFCNAMVITTVLHYDDSTFVQALAFESGGNNSCILLNKSEYNLSNEQWEKFEYFLEQSDLWGLKSRNGVHGLDGSSITVYGLRKLSPYQLSYEANRTYVYRWRPSSGLSKPYFYLIYLSEFKDGCVWESNIEFLD